MESQEKRWLMWPRTGVKSAPGCGKLDEGSRSKTGDFWVIILQAMTWQCFNVQSRCDGMDAQKAASPDVGIQNESV